MPLSLTSFLQSHPFKKKDCLEHICKSLKLSSNGTVETMRTRIIDHVESKQDPNERMLLDDKVKDIARRFKTSEHKKTKETTVNGNLSNIGDNVY